MERRYRFPELCKMYQRFSLDTDYIRRAPIWIFSKQASHFALYVLLHRPVHSLGNRDGKRLPIPYRQMRKPFLYLQPVTGSRYTCL